MNPLPPVTTTLAIGIPLVIRSRLVMHPALGVHPVPPCLRRSADICAARSSLPQRATAPTDTSRTPVACGAAPRTLPPRGTPRSEEHTSELQSQSNLVCRLLLEKKKIPNNSK